jgi:hypothetical protein
MAVTVLTGQRLTADLLNSLQPTFVVKQANESLTSNTTLQNDDELTISGGAGTWFVELDLIMTSANSGAAGTADVKTAWTQTGTISPANRKVLGPSTDTGSSDNSMTSRYGVHGMTTAIQYRGRSGGSQFHVIETAQFVATTSWSITLQWAQATSSATAMTVVAGSFFKAERQEN